MFVFSSTAFLLPLLYTVIAQEPNCTAVEPNCTAVGFGDIEATSGNSNIAIRLAIILIKTFVRFPFICRYRSHSV